MKILAKGEWIKVDDFADNSKAFVSGKHSHINFKDIEETVELSLPFVLHETSLKMIDHPDWRIGQCFFNALAHVAPWVAEDIRGTSLDPFYIEDNLPHFFLYLKGLSKP